MRRCFLLFLLSVLMFSFTQCSSTDENAVAYNEHVAGFTSGRISSLSSVFVILSEDLSEEQMKRVDLTKLFSISPETKGSCSFMDAHTLVFKPAEKFAFNQTYDVSVDLDEIYDDGSEEFKFSFQTTPFGLNGSFEGLDVDAKGDFVFNYLVRTTGELPMERVKSLVKVALEDRSVETVEWTEKNGSEFFLKAFVKKEDGDRSEFIRLMCNEDASLGLEQKDLSERKFPYKDKFYCYDISYKTGAERCVQVTFTKDLDEKQNLFGLAYLEGHKSQAVEVKGNKLKLYPDNNASGSVAVKLSANIRSKDGVELGENVEEYIDLQIDKPSLEFVDEGVIIPQSDKMTVAFRSIYLKGVRVRVFKMFSNNLISWLQRGSLSEFSDLRLFARPVAVTTFFMDETSDFTQWRNYAIDLSDLMKVEAGCMYRIELEMDHRLSAWPGASEEPVDKMVFEKEDHLRLAELGEYFDETGSYYSMDYNTNWSFWNWREHNDPSKKSYYIGKQKGKNVFATNIGLVAYSPFANQLTVLAMDLQSAEPISGAEIEVYNHQNQLIAKGATDGNGRFDCSSDSRKGAPFLVMARKGTDVSGLRVVRGEELSTSTFDVSGDELQKGLKGYIYGERGVWRPGDTLHLSFMLCDKEKTLPAKHPVSLELINPQGQVYRTMTKTVGALGLYTFSLPTEASVPTGSWLVNVRVGGATFSKRLRIETIKPNRLKIDFRLPHEVNSNGEEYKLHTEWLNGNATHNLKYEVDVKLSGGSTHFNKWKDYCFDDCTKAFKTKEEQLAKGVTNGSGDANVYFNISSIKDAPGKLQCAVTTRVYEESGEFSTDVQNVTYSPYNCYVGIKSPQEEGAGCLQTGKKHRFSLVTVDPEGNEVNKRVGVYVYKVNWYWWWSSSSYQLANYYQSSSKELVEEFSIDTQSTPYFDLNFPDSDWGTYLIVAKSGSGHSSSILAYFDWTDYRSRDGRENSTALTILSDKKEYKPGEQITLTIPTTQEGQAIVSLCNSGRVLDMKLVKCNAGNTIIKFEATEEMMPTAYVTATLLQPYDHTAHNDMPIRLYGVAPISVVSEESRLHPEIICKTETKPLSKFVVNVKEENEKEMAYSLAVVDEGLLDLTRFKTPNAWETFYAREAYGMRIWDLYSLVSGAFGGKIDQMFSVGGDESLLNGPKAVVNRFAPMVYFEGPFVLKAGDKNVHEIAVPNYNGRVRVMVVAGNGTAYGSAEKSVKVTQPLMVIGTMSRQIGVGDEATVSATIFSSEDGLGKVSTTIACSDGLTVVGESVAETELVEKGDKTVRFKVRAGAKGGVGKVKILSVSGDEKSSYVAEIPIRVVSQRLFKSEDFMVEAGAKKTRSLGTLGSERLSTTLEVSQLKPLNASGRVAQVMSRPYDCAEHICSKALSQLYLGDFAQLSDAQKKKVEQNIKTTLQNLLKYQTNEGGFANWPNNSYSDHYTSAYVLLFLNKVAEKGYLVNESMHSNLVRYVQNQARNWKPNTNDYDNHIAALSVYALASSNRSNTQELGVMNRMKAALKELSDNDQNLLAATYAIVGQRQVAKEIMKAQGLSTSYSSSYSADISKLIAQTLIEDEEAIESAESLRAKLASDQWLSTMEVAMAFHAMDLFYKKNGSSEDMNFRLDVNQKKFAEVSEQAKMWCTEISQNAEKSEVSIVNKGSSNIYVTANMEGWANQCPVSEISNGLSVKVTYDGKTSPQTVAQGSEISVVINVSNISGKNLNNIAITQILPAGMEILSADKPAKADYQDVRDDRLLSYIGKMARGESVQIVVKLSATYQGNYYMPACTAEDMYNKSIFGCNASGVLEIK